MLHCPHCVSVVKEAYAGLLRLLLAQPSTAGPGEGGGSDGDAGPGPSSAAVQQRQQQPVSSSDPSSPLPPGTSLLPGGTGPGQEQQFKCGPRAPGAPTLAASVKGELKCVKRANEQAARFLVPGPTTRALCDLHRRCPRTALAAVVCTVRRTLACADGAPWLPTVSALYVSNFSPLGGELGGCRAAFQGRGRERVTGMGWQRRGS